MPPWPLNASWAVSITVIVGWFGLWILVKGLIDFLQWIYNYLFFSFLAGLNSCLLSLDVCLSGIAGTIDCALHPDYTKCRVCLFSVAFDQIAWRMFRIWSPARSSFSLTFVASGCEHGTCPSTHCSTSTLVSLAIKLASWGGNPGSSSFGYCC